MRFVGIGVVMERVIRNMGLNKIPNHYHTAMIEHIADGLELLKTDFLLGKESAELKVENHLAELPCDFASILSVEKEGMKVLLGSDITDFRFPTSNNHQENKEARTNNVVFAPISMPAGILKEQLLIPVERYSERRHYYQERGNDLMFSFPTGKVRLHYKKWITDEQGYPMIPDIGSVKEGLMWYVLSRLILGGYEHKTITFESAINMWEGRYFPRALSDLKPYTTEKAERLLRSQLRLIPNLTAGQDFFVNQEQFQDIRFV